MTGFTDNSNAWTQAWLDMQKQYLDTWTNLSRQGLPGALPASPFSALQGNAWADAFAQWSKLFEQSMPAGTKDISARLLELGKSYLGMSENLWKMLQQGNADAAGWQQALQQSIAQAGTPFSLPGGNHDPWSGFATLWGLPVSNWQRMATSFSPFPGEMEKALRPDHLPPHDVLTRAMQQYLSLPALGYTREWQDQQQEWLDLFMEYSRALQAFGGLLGKVVQRALELFGRRMAEKSAANEPFENLRDIYNLWIDCGEEAYAETVATAEFPQLQADLVNALMRVKRHEQLMVEEVLTAFNMPTRSELDTTHKRVYELQQQLCRLQEQLEDAQDAGAAPPARRTATKKKARASTRRAKPKTRKE